MTFPKLMCFDFWRGKIGTDRVPRYVRCVDNWPMSVTKIKKVILGEKISDELKSKDNSGW